MATLTVRFLDNEVVSGTAEKIDLDEPDFHLDSLSDEGGNNRSAWVPLPAVKKISLYDGPADEHAAKATRMVALRFQDGEVVRGYLNGSLERFRYGLTMTIYSKDRERMSTVAVPYTALKALFYLKTWDSRPMGYQSDDAGIPPLTHLVADMREAASLYRRGAMTRKEFLARRRRLLSQF